jgi:hypothetical protein
MPGVPPLLRAFPLRLTVLKRGPKPSEPPQIGCDGKWQLNLYDPAFTRVELIRTDRLPFFRSTRGNKKRGAVYRKLPVQRSLLAIRYRSLALRFKLATVCVIMIALTAI